MPDTRIADLPDKTTPAATDTVPITDNAAAGATKKATVESLSAPHVGAGDPHSQYQLESEKNQANGYAGLDASGLLSPAQIPASFATDAEVTGAISSHEGATNPHSQYQLGSGKGVANGYASLDAGGKVPDAQIPDSITRDSELSSSVSSAISTHEGAVDPHPGYQKESEKGAVSGYASLDATGKIPTAQLGTGTADATTYLRGDRTFAPLSVSTIGGVSIDTTELAHRRVLTLVGATQAKFERLPSIDPREKGALMAYSTPFGGTQSGSTTFDVVGEDFSIPIPGWNRVIQVGDCIAIARARSGAKWHVTTVAAVMPGGVINRLTLEEAPSATVLAGTAHTSIGPSGQEVYIQQCLDEMAAEDGGSVLLEGHYFTSNTVFGKHRTRLHGLNHRSSGIIAADGHNHHVVQNKVSSNGTTDTNAEFFMVDNLTICGNSSGQDGGNYHCLYLTMNPLFSRLPSFADEEEDAQAVVYNVYLCDAAADGMFWEGLASHAFYSIASENNTRDGFSGTSDTHAAMLVAGLNGRRGFSFSPSASSQFVGCKAFGNGGNNHAEGVGWYVTGRSGAVSLLACDAQENWAEGLRIQNANGVSFYGSIESNSVKSIPSVGEAAVPGITVNDSYYCRVIASCSDANWNADGGSQKTALQIIGGSHSNKIDILHFAGDKGFGYPELTAPISAGSDTDLNEVTVNGQKAMAIGGWYSTTPTGVWDSGAGAPDSSTGTSSKTMGTRTLYFAHTFISKGGLETLPGPIGTLSLTGTQKLKLTAPTSFPANVWGVVFYVGDTNSAASLHRQSKIITSAGGVWTEPDQGYLTTGSAPPTVVQLALDGYRYGHLIQDLAGNVTVLPPTYAHKGQVLTLTFRQNSSGNNRLFWDSAFVHTWIQNVEGNRIDTVQFVYDGTSWTMTSTPPSLIFSQGPAQAGDTVSNTASQTPFATQALIPAGQLKAGMVLEIEAYGPYGTAAAAPTWDFALFGGSAGTTLLADMIGTVTPDANTTSNRLWHFRATIKILTTGVTGTAEINGMFDWNRNSSGVQTGSIRPNSAGSVQTATINTTTDNFLRLAPTMGTADVANTMTMRSLTVRKAA